MRSSELPYNWKFQFCQTRKDSWTSATIRSVGHSLLQAMDVSIRKYTYSHPYTHPMIRVTENEPEALNEVSPQTTEAQLADSKQRAEKIDEKLHKVANHVLGDGSNLPLSKRLTRIEQTLERIVSKLNGIETTR